MSRVQILAGTKNQGKLREMDLCLRGSGVDRADPSLLESLPEPEEGCESYLDNARLKARAYSEGSGLPCLAEDSGLEVDALQGLPGVHSARWAGPGARDPERIEKLMQALSGKHREERGAQFVCVAVLWVPGVGAWTTRGVCRGEILDQNRGGSGFGYDPVFAMPGLERTMAELSLEEKCAISHRAEALRRMWGVLSRLEDLRLRP